MKVLRDTWLIFGRYFGIFIHNPVWVALGVLQPLGEAIQRTMRELRRPSVPRHWLGFRPVPLKHVLHSPLSAFASAAPRLGGPRISARSARMLERFLAY